MKKFSDLRQHKLNESVLMYAAATADQNNVGVNSQKAEEETSETNQTVYQKITTAAKSNQPESFKLQDGSVVQITPIEASNVVYAYEELNIENQEIFESFLENNIQTYSMIIEFCEEYK